MQKNNPNLNIKPDANIQSLLFVGNKNASAEVSGEIGRATVVITSHESAGTVAVATATTASASFSSTTDSKDNSSLIKLQGKKGGVEIRYFEDPDPVNPLNNFNLSSAGLKEVREVIKNKTPIKANHILDLILEYYQASLTYALKAHYCNCHQLVTPMLKQPQLITDINLSITKTRQEKIKRENKNEKDTKTGLSIDEKTFSKPQQYFEQMYNVSVTEVVKPNEIFQRRKDDKQEPKKILILGRAGVGKTTMSQYFAHQWAQGKLWQQFDYVFWIPLRNLGRAKYQTAKVPIILAYVIQQECFDAKTPTTINLCDIEHALHETHKIVLLLDGYDEVVHLVSDEKNPVSNVLKEALAFPTVILTSRPYHTQRLNEFNFVPDHALENMGFTDNNIESYTDYYFSHLKFPQSEQAKTLLTFLKTNLSIWGSMHIPINLALMCDVWQSAADSKEQLSSQMIITSLYQTITRYLLKTALRDRWKMNVDNQSVAWLYQQCAREISCLEQLAFGGLQTLAINLTSQLQERVIANVEREHKVDSKQEIYTKPLFTRALELGFLRAANDNRQDDIEKEHYFIHLTFQEFFAARYLMHCIQQNHTPLCQQAVEFIRTHKYHPRYHMVLGFTAALLSAEPLNVPASAALIHFWQALLAPPLDLTGFHHLRLITHCLEQAQCDPHIPHRDTLLQHIREWFNGITRNSYYISSLWQINYFSLLHNSSHVLTHCHIVKNLLKDTSDKEVLVRRNAANVLGQLGKASDTVIQALLTVLLRDTDSEVKRCSASALSELGKSSDTAIQALTRALSDENVDVRRHVASALGKSSKPSDTIIEALFIALCDKQSMVRSDAAAALGQLGKASGTVIRALLTKLSDEDYYVRNSAARALGELGDSSDVVIQALLTALLSTDHFVRGAAARALGKLGNSSDDVIQALLTALDDKNEFVKYSAADALGELGNSSNVVIKALLTALSTDHFVRSAAARALGKLGDSSDVVIQALTRALSDENVDVKVYAARALEQLGKASDAIGQELLITFFRDQNKYFKNDAARALGELGNSSNVVIQALLTALSTDPLVKKNAAHALGQLRLSEELLMSWKESIIKQLIAEDSYLYVTTWKIILAVYFTSENAIWAQFIAKRAFASRVGISIASVGVIIHDDSEEVIAWPSAQKRSKLALPLIKAFASEAKKQELPDFIPQSYLTGKPLYPLRSITNLDHLIDSKNEKVLSSQQPLQSSAANNAYSFFHTQIPSEAEPDVFLQEIASANNSCRIL